MAVFERNAMKIAALVAVAGTVGAASGQVGAVDPIHPIFGNFEAVNVFGIDNANDDNRFIVVQFSAVDAGGDATITAGDGTIEFAFFNAAGDNITPGSAPAISAANIGRDAANDIAIKIAGDDSDNIVSGDIFAIDVAQIAGINDPNVAMIDVILVSSDPADDENATRDSMIVDLDGTTEDPAETFTDAIDERFQLIRSAPTFSGAFLANVEDSDPALDELQISVAFPLIGPNNDQDVITLTAGGDANPNSPFYVGSAIAGGTPLAAGTGLTDDDFLVGGDPANGLTPVTAISPRVGDATIQIAFADTSNLTDAVDDGDALSASSLATANSDLRDASGGRIGGEVDIANQTNFEPTEVNFTASTVGFATGQIELIFPRNIGVEGDTGGGSFYEDSIEIVASGLPAADVTDFVLSGATIDPDMPNRLTINVDNVFGGNDANIRPDGRSTGGGSAEFELPGQPFQISLDAENGTPPADLFGNEFDGTITLAIGDGIAPSLTNFGYSSDPVTGEFNEFVVVANEPLGADSASATGVTFFIGDVDDTFGETFTVQPPSMLNQTTLELMDADITEGEDLAANTIAVGTVTLGPIPARLADDSDDADTAFESNRTLRFPVDTALLDLNGDGTVDADDLALIPGSNLDVDLFSILIDTDNLIVDASGNALADFGGDEIEAPLAEDATDAPDAEQFGSDDAESDFATPALIAARHREGDNFDVNGFQTLFEQDGDFGPDFGLPGLQGSNDALDAAFSESVQADGNTLAAEVSHSNGFFDDDATVIEGVFFGGDGVPDNVIRIFDNDDGSSPFNFPFFPDDNDSGFGPGDDIAFSAANSVEDNQGNAFGGNALGGDNAVVATDGTIPFVPSFLDVNEDALLQAFVNDADGQGLVTSIDLNFISGSNGIDAMTVLADSFTAGLTDFAAAVSGDTITLTPSGGSALQLGPVDVLYNLADDAEMNLADTVGNAVDENLGTSARTIEAAPIAQPDIAGEAPSVFQLALTLTRDGQPLPAGSSVSAMVATPRAKFVTINVAKPFGLGFDSFTLTDAQSLSAVDNFLLGCSPSLFAGGDLTFGNGESIAQGVSLTNDRDMGDVKLEVVPGQAPELAGLLFTGANFVSNIDGIGENTSSNVIQEVNIFVCLGWDILGSQDGTLVNFNAGPSNFGGVGEAPIVSRAVVTSNDGTVALNVSAPNPRFNNGFGPAFLFDGNPVILVVTEPDGTRTVVSSMFGTTEGAGPILFDTAQTEINSGFTAQALDLANSTTRLIGNGWNVIANNSAMGYQETNADGTNEGGQPLFVNGFTADSIFSNDSDAVTNILRFAAATDQFTLFGDLNEDGSYTASDDDDSPFDTLSIGPAGNAFAAFTLDSQGVKFRRIKYIETGLGGSLVDTMNALFGGYAVGIFQPPVEYPDGSVPSQHGVFQLGAPLPATGVEIAGTGTLLSDGTFGWVLVTAPQGLEQGNDVSRFNITRDGGEITPVINAIYFQRALTSNGQDRVRILSGDAAGNGNLGDISTFSNPPVATSDAPLFLQSN